MRHQLSEQELLAKLGSASTGAAQAIERCVHCGFCLATCPTYSELADEADSPRGRIVLMKSVLEGEIELEQALPHVDGCLGCLACESSCPSGVEYGALLGPFRELAERERAPDRGRSRMRQLMLSTLESPKRLLWLTRLAQLSRPFARVLPESLRSSMDLLPRAWPRRCNLPGLSEPLGERRARVLLFPGCVQQVFESDVHLATIEVLTRCGVEVTVPSDTGCCGALAAHVGEVDRARVLAKRNVAALRPAVDDFDAVLTNVAGCGSGLAEYPRWLADSAHAEDANALVAKSQDVSSFLCELGIPQPAELARPVSVVVQDACHLRHAQGVISAPRELLQRIPGLEVCEPREPEVCCGSAGLYNVEQPEMAFRLGRRKARKLVDSGADMVVTGNVGCMLQLQRHLEGHFTSSEHDSGVGEGGLSDASNPLIRLDAIESGAFDVSVLHSRRTTMPVRHTMQVLRDAYRGVLDRGPDRGDPPPGRRQS